MATFKIIGRDNLARETVADRLLLFVPDKDGNRGKAKAFIDWINTFSCDDNGGTHYVIVEEDYRLSKGMEDLV